MERKIQDTRVIFGPDGLSRVKLPGRISNKENRVNILMFFDPKSNRMFAK